MTIPRHQRNGARRLPLLLSGALALVLLFFSAGCGGSDRPVAAPAEPTPPVLPGQGPTVEGLDLSSAAAETTGAGVDPSSDFELVEGLIQSFLNARSDVVTEFSDAFELEPFATQEAIDHVLGELEYNQLQAELDRRGSTIETMYAWPNLTATQTDGERVVIHDCTEQQEYNGYGQFSMLFVEHRYTIEPVPAGEEHVNGVGWRIAAIEQLHNGFLERDARFGCLPQSFAERAEAAAGAMWTEFISLARDPEGHGPLSDVFSDDLAERLAADAQEQAAANLVLSSPESVSFQAIGIDTQAGLLSLSETGTVVMVESCRTFPEGLEVTDSETGEVSQGLPPGGELALWMYVQLSTGPNGPTGPDQVRAFETGPNGCGNDRTSANS